MITGNKTLKPAVEGALPIRGARPLTLGSTSNERNRLICCDRTHIRGPTYCNIYGGIRSFQIQKLSEGCHCFGICDLCRRRVPLDSILEEPFCRRRACAIPLDLALPRRSLASDRWAGNTRLSKKQAPTQIPTSRGWQPAFTPHASSILDSAGASTVALAERK